MELHPGETQPSPEAGIQEGLIRSGMGLQGEGCAGVAKEASLGRGEWGGDTVSPGAPGLVSASLARLGSNSRGGERPSGLGHGHQPFSFVPILMRSELQMRPFSRRTTGQLCPCYVLGAARGTALQEMRWVTGIGASQTLPPHTAPCPEAQSLPGMGLYAWGVSVLGVTLSQLVPRDWALGIHSGYRSVPTLYGLPSFSHFGTPLLCPWCDGITSFLTDL